MNEPFLGGMGSFTLSCMVIAYLQSYYKSPTSDPGGAYLSFHLINFFSLYCERFDFTNVGISIRKGGFFFLKDQKIFDEYHNGILSIENPMEPSKDLALNTREFELIRQDWSKIYSKLLKHSEIRPDESFIMKSGLLTRYPSSLHPLPIKGRQDLIL